MSTARTRPSAIEAIEGLKIVQLRKENVLIFDEIRSLREEVTSRCQELGGLRKELSEVKSKITDVNPNDDEHRKRFEALESGMDIMNDSLRKLDQEQETIAQDCSTRLDSNRSAVQMFEDTFKKLGEDLQQLQCRLGNIEDTHTATISRLRDNLEEKADYTDVTELRERVENLIQYMDQRMKEQPPLSSVSRVADTFDQLTSQPAEPISEISVMESFWQPIDPVAEPSNRMQIGPESPASKRFTDCSAVENESEVSEHPPEAGQTGNTAKMQCNPAVQKYSGISNIYHQGAEQSEHPDQAQLDGVVQSPEHSRLLVTTSKHHTPIKGQGRSLQAAEEDSTHLMPQMAREILHQLLRLKQNGGLVDYFNRLQGILISLPPHEEVDSICLRRFVSGMTVNDEKCLLAEWLETSEWSSQNARDFIVLLSKLSKGMDHLREVAGPQDANRKNVQQEVAEIVESVAESAVIRRLANEGEASLGSNEPPARPSPKLRAHDTDSPIHEVSPDAVERIVPNVTTRAAARAIRSAQQQTSKSRINNKPLKERRKEPAPPRTSKDHSLPRADMLSHKSGRDISKYADANGDPATMERHATPETPATVTHDGISVMVQESCIRTPQRQALMSQPATPSKINAQHTILDDMDTALPSSPPCRPCMMTPKSFQLGPKPPNPFSRRQVPALLPRKQHDMHTIPETSDAIGLPPMPESGQVDEITRLHRRLSKRRRLSYDTAPELPVLAGTTNDAMQ